MEAEHIEHTEELQSYFMTRMSNYVRSKGKEVMGWDELTNSTLPERCDYLWLARFWKSGVESCRTRASVYYDAC